MARRPYGKTQPSQHTSLTPTKAKKMLHEGKAQGHPITERQRKFFGAVASRGERGR